MKDGPINTLHHAKRPIKVVFLDRDGTLNEDPGYLSDPAQLRLLPGVGEALSILKASGYALAVVSNQSGVGRGLIRQEILPAIHERLSELLSPWSVSIDHYELCFHKPEDQCECRKPKPKLILDAARALGADLSASYMVGDKKSDLLAGRAAGCKAVALVRTGSGLEAEASLRAGEADCVADSLDAVAAWIAANQS